MTGSPSYIARTVNSTAENRILGKEGGCVCVDNNFIAVGKQGKVTVVETMSKRSKQALKKAESNLARKGFTHKLHAQEASRKVQEEVNRGSS